MKKNITEKEKLIIESFAKNFNKIKRIDEEKIEEINIGKGIAGLGIAAALAGSPQKSIAQTSMTDKPNVSMTAPTAEMNISTQTDFKAGLTLLKSFRKNPFSAESWAKENKYNLKLFKAIKNLVDEYASGGELQKEEVEQLGAGFKTNPLAQSFIGRNDKLTAQLENEYNA